VRGKYVDHTVDALHGRVGVQRGEDQVTRFRDGQRGLDRLEIAHLADQHHVGVLAQHVLERLLEAGGVVPDLALVDQAALVRVQVLDRILDRHDVLARLLVDLVDDGGQRRALAGAGRPGHEHQPAGACGELRHGGRQTELVVTEDLEGDGPERRRHGTALNEEVGAVARQAFHAKGEVELLVGLELASLLLGQDGVAELLRLDGPERRQLERHDLAIDAQQRRGSGGDVEIARTLLDHGPQQLVQVDFDVVHPGLYGQQQRGRIEGNQSDIVTRKTSSAVVTPSRILPMPLMRSEIMPPRMAPVFSSALDAPCSTISFSSSRKRITS
jgi:hypothetical protein